MTREEKLERLTEIAESFLYRLDDMLGKPEGVPSMEPLVYSLHPVDVADQAVRMYRTINDDPNHGDAALVDLAMAFHAGIALGRAVYGWQNPANSPVLNLPWAAEKGGGQ